jgi:hypothetical protein
MCSPTTGEDITQGRRGHKIWASTRSRTHDWYAPSMRIKPKEILKLHVEMKQMHYVSPKSRTVSGSNRIDVGGWRYAPDYGGVVALTFSTVICGGW